MKILVVCQHYYPEPFRITDICEEWVKQGHEVSVVSGKPNYPMGEIYEGYEGKKKQDEIINGVKVHRCYEIPRKKGIMYRFFNYYSFVISATNYAKRLKEEFDVVFANQLSPVMMVNPALAYKKKHGAKTVLYCLDLWPDSLVAGGVKRTSLIYKYYHFVSKKIYRAVDKIAITSKLFKSHLTTQFGIDEKKITYIPQYAESLFDANTCKKAEGETIDLLFAGNVGAAQSVETIIRAAEKTQDIKNLRWHIVGDGISLNACQDLATELNVKTVTFYGRKPLEEMPSLYQKADAMLVTMMKDEVLSLTLPGKVQTYMAAGKPIIAAADGEVATVIESADCGMTASSQDYNELANCVRKFCKLESAKRIELGENALRFYEDCFSKSVFFERMEEFLR